MNDDDIIALLWTTGKEESRRREVVCEDFEQNVALQEHVYGSILAKPLSVIQLYREPPDKIVQEQARDFATSLLDKIGDGELVGTRWKFKLEVSHNGVVRTQFTALITVKPRVANAE